MNRNQITLNPAPFEAKTRGARLTSPRARRVVMLLSVANFVGLLVLCFLLDVMSEKWWFSMALTYLPRSPYLVLTIVLALFSFRWCRKANWVNFGAMVLVLVPVMGLRIPFETLGYAESTKPYIKILSCNVQGYHPDFLTVLKEVSRVNPDIVAFQEIAHESDLLKEYFHEWHSVHVTEFWIGSKFPIRLVGQCDFRQFKRTTAIKVEVEGPTGTFMLSNVHLMTAQRSLDELSFHKLLTSDEPYDFRRHIGLRDEEAFVTRAFVSDGDASVPAIVVGDFNLPMSSNLYRAHWGEFQNAFDVVGFGFGYTSPCRPHRFWFDGVPWLRIDHILTSQHWDILDCRVGSKNGSDHRLVTAEVAAK